MDEDQNPQNRLSVDDSASDISQEIEDHAIPFYYLNAGVKTVDAGQAAGTIIFGNVGYRNIQNALGEAVGYHLDSSFVFGTGTTLTTQVALNEDVKKSWSKAPLATKVAKYGDLLTANGQFILDHETGFWIGKKADAGVSDTATFLISVSLGYILANLISGYIDNANNIARIKSKLINDLEYSSVQDFWAAPAAITEVKAAPVAVGKISIYNTNATAVYLILKNSLAALITTVTAVDHASGDKVFFIPGNSSRHILASDFPEGQLFFSVGLQMGISTTPTLHTSSANAADCRIELHRN